MTEGWVYIAPRHVLSERRLVELAALHPVFIYDAHVMVDLRRFATDIEVWKSEPTERSAWDWYWKGPWVEAVEPVRVPAEEARLAELVDDFHRHVAR